MDDNGQVLLYKLWPGDAPRMWYFLSVNPAVRKGSGKLCNRIVWTDNVNEATPLDHQTAWGYAKTLKTNYTAGGSESCTIGVMPYNGPGAYYTPSIIEPATGTGGFLSNPPYGKQENE